MAEEKEEVKTYTPSEKEKKDQKMVFDRFDNMKKGQERKEAEDHWKDAEMLDAGDTGETRDEDDWRSNIFFNITSPAILTALQEIIEAPPVYNPTPGGKDDIPKAPIMAVIMKYTLYQSDYLKELVKIFHTALKYGVAFVQEYNKEDPRVIQELKDYDPDTDEIKYEEKTINEKKLVSELIPPYMFFWDEMATEIEESRDCIRRYIMNVDEFKRVFKLFKWAKNVNFVQSGGDTQWDNYYPQPKDVTANDVEVLYYWNRSLDKLIITANMVVIRSTPNPYMHKELPFGKFIGVIAPGRMCGKGFPELIKSTQEEMNTYRNMLVDQGKLNIYKQFLVSTRMDIDDEDLIPQPSGHIPVDNEPGESVNSYIQPLEYGGIKAEIFEIIKGLSDDGKRILGIDDRMQSVATGGTATETAILKESSLKRIRLILKTNQWGALTRLGRLRLMNIQQFFTQKQASRIVGEDGIEITDSQFMNIPLDGVEIKNENNLPSVVKIDGFSIWTVDPALIRGNFDIKVDIEPMLYISKPLQQTKINEAVQVLNSFFPDKFDRDALFSHYLLINELPSNLKMVAPPSLIPNMTKLAELEDEEIAQGKPVPPAQGATPEHIQVHVKFADELGDKLNKKSQGILRVHVQQEVRYAIQAEQMNPPQPIPGGIVPLPGEPRPMMPPAGPNQQASMGRPVAPQKGLSNQNIGRPPMSAREVVPDRNFGEAKV